jgi:hypothetical protein
MKIIAVFGFILLIVFLAVVGPLLTIWALNTLFPALAIPYTFDTWCAVVLIGAFFQIKVKVAK